MKHVNQALLSHSGIKIFSNFVQNEMALHCTGHCCHILSTVALWLVTPKSDYVTGKQLLELTAGTPTCKSCVAQAKNIGTKHPLQLSTCRLQVIGYQLRWISQADAGKICSEVGRLWRLCPS